MHRIGFCIGAFVLGVMGMLATSEAQALQKKGTEEKKEDKVLKFIYLDAATIACEGWYEGSEHSGGGWMMCMARYEITEADGTKRTVDVNVSDQAQWVIDDEIVYWVEYGFTLFDYGLHVDPWWLDVEDGYTLVFVSFQGKSVVGDIVVYDYRDP